MYNFNNLTNLFLYINLSIFFTNSFVILLSYLFSEQRTYKLFIHLYFLLLIFFFCIYLYISETLSFIFLLMETATLFYLACIYLNFNVLKNSFSSQYTVYLFVFITTFTSLQLTWVTQYIKFNINDYNVLQYLYTNFYNYNLFLFILLLFLLTTFIFVSFFDLYKNNRSQKQYLFLNRTLSQPQDSSQFTENFFKNLQNFPIRSFNV